RGTPTPGPRARALRTRCREEPSDLDQERVALSAAGADRREPEPSAVTPEVVDHSGHDPAARCADRVAERDRAAVDVHDLLVDAEHAGRVLRDGGERLVD